MSSAAATSFVPVTSEKTGATLSYLADNPFVKRVPVPPAPTPLFRVQRGTFAAAMAALALSSAPASAGTLGPKDQSEANASFHRVKQPKLIAERLFPLYRELSSFSELSDGWDGEGSVAPKPSVITNAIRFLRLLPDSVKLPDATASADGEVGVYWKSSGVYIDIGFPSDGRISYYAEAHGLVARGAGPFDGETISQELLDVIARA